MKYLPLLFVLIAWNIHAQEIIQPLSFKSSPISVSVNANAIAFPAHHIREHFKNIGVRIGTELYWNKRGNLAQSINLGFFRNRLNGNGVYLNTEFIYRPMVWRGLHFELKAGPGISEIFLPMKAWEADGNGGWKKASATTPLVLQVHAGTGFSYEYLQVANLSVSPFINYELVAVTGYNPSIPVLPTTFIHAGSRIRF